MAAVIETARAGLLGMGETINWSHIGIAFLVSTVIFAVGMLYFKKAERTLADII